ncbi:MAG TPA: hypothetical protein PK693_08170, partial [Halothiobacillus sp.]|nr:hypothetical protein [Halothiobacillus sp.]
IIARRDSLKTSGYSRCPRDDRQREFELPIAIRQLQIGRIVVNIDIFIRTIFTLKKRSTIAQGKHGLSLRDTAHRTARKQSKGRKVFEGHKNHSREHKYTMIGYLAVGLYSTNQD